MTLASTQKTRTSSNSMMGDVGLSPLHDQADEENRQQALLLSRFNGFLEAGGLPADVVKDVVRMKYGSMIEDDFDVMTVFSMDED